MPVEQNPLYFTLENSVYVLEKREQHPDFYVWTARYFPGLEQYKGGQSLMPYMLLNDIKTRVKKAEYAITDAADAKVVTVWLAEAGSSQEKLLESVFHRYEQYTQPMKIAFHPKNKPAFMIFFHPFEESRDWFEGLLAEMEGKWPAVSPPEATEISKWSEMNPRPEDTKPRKLALLPSTIFKHSGEFFSLTTVERTQPYFVGRVQQLFGAGEPDKETIRVWDQNKISIDELKMKVSSLEVGWKETVITSAPCSMIYIAPEEKKAIFKELQANDTEKRLAFKPDDVSVFILKNADLETRAWLDDTLSKIETRRAVAIISNEPVDGLINKPKPLASEPAGPEPESELTAGQILPEAETTTRTVGTGESEAPIATLKAAKLENDGAPMEESALESTLGSEGSGDAKADTAEMPVEPLEGSLNRQVTEEADDPSVGVAAEDISKFETPTATEAVGKEAGMTVVATEGAAEVPEAPTAASDGRTSPVEPSNIEEPSKTNLPAGEEEPGTIQAVTAGVEAEAEPAVGPAAEPEVHPAIEMVVSSLDEAALTRMEAPVGEPAPEIIEDAAGPQPADEALVDSPFGSPVPGAAPSILDLKRLDHPLVLELDGMHYLLIKPYTVGQTSMVWQARKLPFEALPARAEVLLPNAGTRQRIILTDEEADLFRQDDPGLGELVALKLARPGQESRLEDEIYALRRLGPAVLQLFYPLPPVELAEEFPCLVMEWVRGRKLSEHPPLNERDGLEVAYQLASLLLHIRSVAPDIIPTDSLKADGLFIDGSAQTGFRVKLVDWNVYERDEGHLYEKTLIRFGEVLTRIFAPGLNYSVDRANNIASIDHLAAGNLDEKGIQQWDRLTFGTRNLIRRVLQRERFNGAISAVVPALAAAVREQRDRWAESQPSRRALQAESSVERLAWLDLAAEKAQATGGKLLEKEARDRQELEERVAVSFVEAHNVAAALLLLRTSVRRYPGISSFRWLLMTCQTAVAASSIPRAYEFLVLKNILVWMSERDSRDLAYAALQRAAAILRKLQCETDALPVLMGRAHLLAEIDKAIVGLEDHLDDKQAKGLLEKMNSLLEELNSLEARLGLPPGDKVCEEEISRLKQALEFYRENYGIYEPEVQLTNTRQDLRRRHFEVLVSEARRLVEVDTAFDALQAAWNKCAQAANDYPDLWLEGDYEDRLTLRRTAGEKLAAYYVEQAQNVANQPWPDLDFLQELLGHALHYNPGHVKAMQMYDAALSFRRAQAEWESQNRDATMSELQRAKRGGLVYQTTITIQIIERIQKLGAQEKLLEQACCMDSKDELIKVMGDTHHLLSSPEPQQEIIAAWPGLTEQALQARSSLRACLDQSGAALTKALEIWLSEQRPSAEEAIDLLADKLLCIQPVSLAKPGILILVNYIRDRLSAFLVEEKDWAARQNKRLNGVISAYRNMLAASEQAS